MSQSPPNAVSRQIRRLLSTLLVTFLCPSLWAFPLRIEFTAAAVEYQGLQLQQVDLQTTDDGSIRLNIEQATLDSQPELKANAISAHCSQLGVEFTSWCPGGEWQLLLGSRTERWQQSLRGFLTDTVWNEQLQSLGSSVVAGNFHANLQLNVGPAASDKPSDLVLKWSGQSLASLPFRPLLPSQIDWIDSGSSSGTVSLALPPSQASATSKPAPLKLRYQLSLNDTSLDSPDGRFAAAGLKLRAQGEWQPGDIGQLELETEFLGGEVLLDRFYTAFGPHSLRLNIQLDFSGEQVEVADLQLSDGNALQFRAKAGFSLQNPLDSLKYQVKQLDMQFPLAYERYLEPVLAPWTLDKLAVTGGFSWKGGGEGGEFPSGALRFNDLSVVDRELGRFAFTGLSASIDAGQSTGQSSFSWRGLLLGRINFGAGAIALKTAPGSFALAGPLQLDVLGGKFLVDDFSLQLPAANASNQEPVVNFNAALEAVDMELLTAALGWPAFAGKISGRIPGARFDQGVLAVDGVLRFAAFDGQIELSKLRIERLFGVLPSLAANLDVQDLDLQLLTSAFSFGSIAGRLDGYVHDLRMLDWSPVSFDAWMGTPKRQGDSRNISRQAVNNLTSIGGGGATAVLTGPVMRMFSSFSYRRLGLGCRLENHVCFIRGLADDDNSVVIMEGSGIPKLTIRVFNRSMDWPQLVSNLVAASSGESIRIGDP